MKLTFWEIDLQLQLDLLLWHLSRESDVHCHLGFGACFDALEVHRQLQLPQPQQQQRLCNLPLGNLDSKGIEG